MTTLTDILPVPFERAREASEVARLSGRCHLVQVAAALTGGKEGFIIADHDLPELFWDSVGNCFGVRVYCTAAPDDGFAGSFKVVLEDRGE